MLFVVVLVLGGPLGAARAALPADLAELYLGNVNLLIALAIVVGLRWPAAWAFVLLTKITPGHRRALVRVPPRVAVVRDRARRDGRGCRRSRSLLAPHWWFEFRDAMTVQAGARPRRAASGHPDLPADPAGDRRGRSSCLGARTDRAWLVPVAATIAAPALWWNVFVILVAVRPAARGPRPDAAAHRPWPVRRVAGRGTRDAPVRDRLLRDGFVILSVVFVGLRLFAIEPWADSVDAYAYWTTRTGDYYAAAETGRIGAYLYSPAFAQLSRRSPGCR